MPKPSLPTIAGIDDVPSVDAIRPVAVQPILWEARLNYCSSFQRLAKPGGIDAPTGNLIYLFLLPRWRAAAFSSGSRLALRARNGHAIAASATARGTHR